MRKVKKKHHQPWCKFCPERTVKAEWQSQHCCVTKHACNEHKSDLDSYEKSHTDSGRMSEADYQTWARL